MEKKPKLYVISGCNGAGKTTASYTVLPEMLECQEFVNADEIARGLSPFNPESVAIEAGRLMLVRIREHISHCVDFAFETTLATRMCASFIKRAQKQGYHVTLVYLWLNSHDLAFSRVANRVASGGHNIDEEIIKRRYYSGIFNLFNLYMEIVDYWMLLDNSGTVFDVIAEGIRNESIYVVNPKSYQILEQYGRERNI
ncbi:MAG: zeta toxin family protein [Bacteroidales bacterium]|jgi:predicted ABC-type ATPase|nr:zeta toxin family protein [Bacteroidales bacterium]